MKAICTACNRTIGLASRRCPYCGERVAQSTALRLARVTLPLTIIVSLGLAAVLARNEWEKNYALILPMLRMPTSTILTTLAITLAIFPCFQRACIPGAVTPETGRQRLGESVKVLFFGLSLLVCALLVCLPATLKLAASPALIALLCYPRVMQVAVYPLLVIPIVASAYLTSLA